MQEHEIRFDSSEIELAGTLALPGSSGPFTGVLFITGSGQVDRNENHFNQSYRIWEKITKEGKIMSTKENKELVRQDFKEWNEIAGDVAKIRLLFEKYYAPGYIYHHPSGGDINREQRIQHMITLVSALPDSNFSVDDIVAEGDKVVNRFTIQGTHNGTFMGIPATGKHIVIKGVQIYKIEGRRVVEMWELVDALGVMAQLGVVPDATPKK